MKRPMSYWLATALSVAGCSTQNSPAEDVLAETRGPAPAQQAPVDENHDGTAAEASQNAPTFSNVVSAGGKVTTTLGAMRNVKTAMPIRHVFQTPDGPFPARIYLSHSVVDADGNMIIFNINYLNESEPFKLVEHGFLSAGLVNNQASESYASDGIVVVSSTAESQLSIDFEGLEMVHRDLADGTVTPATPLGDGRVVGEVERVCVVDSSQGDRVDPTWSSPFCAQYAN
jgi:hypothetical protein